MPVDHADGLTIDIQINHGWIGFAEHVELALLAEWAGFGTLWVADHLSGQSMRAPSMPECFATLGGLAASTSRIGLGSLVANAQLRHPALLANAAATIQQMSGGRFALGIGAGASPTSSFAKELVTAGLTVPTALSDRHHTLVDQIEVIKSIWSDERDQRFDGFPSPSPRPKIIIGVNSPELARLAIRHADGINVRASHPQVDEILEIAAGHIETSVWVSLDAKLLEDWDEHLHEWSARGLQRVVAVMTGKPDRTLIKELC